jgi:hypothetical protein
MKRIWTAIGIAVLALVAPVSHASVIREIAILAGANEIPVVVTPGTGFAIITIDTVAQTLRVQVTFSDLVGTTTASHIHCCAPQPANVGVATVLPTFTGFPLGVTSGTYDHTFDLTLATTYNPAFITLHGGTVGSAEADLIAGIAGGQAYLNVHTTFRPSGEIRGVLVPEPGSLALLGLSGMLMAMSLTRRAASRRS